MQVTLSILVRGESAKFVWAPDLQTPTLLVFTGRTVSDLHGHNLWRAISVTRHLGLCRDSKLFSFSKFCSTAFQRQMPMPGAPCPAAPMPRCPMTRCPMPRCPMPGAYSRCPMPRCHMPRCLCQVPHAQVPQSQLAELEPCLSGVITCCLLRQAVLWDHEEQFPREGCSQTREGDRRLGQALCPEAWGIASCLLSTNKSLRKLLLPKCICHMVSGGEL